MGFSRQEYWSGVPSPSRKIKTASSQKDMCGSPKDKGHRWCKAKGNGRQTDQGGLEAYREELKEERNLFLPAEVTLSVG